MKLFKLFERHSDTEPTTAETAEINHAIIEALDTYGPMIQRHVRQHNPGGVQDTAQALERLQQQGIVEKTGDLFRLT